MNETKTKRSPWQWFMKNRSLIGYITFWIYNLTFLGFIFFGFGPIVFPAAIKGVSVGIIPAFYAVVGGVLISIPIIASILGITVLRKHLDKLFLLGYGIEGPLMLILGVRFFGLGQTTLPVKIIMVTATLGLLTLFWHILDPRAEEREGSVGYLKSIGLACLIAIGLYASIWILFYVIPIGDLILEEFTNIPQYIGDYFVTLADALRAGLQFGFFVIFGGLVFLFTAILFIFIPLAVPWLYIKAWWSGNKGIGRGAAAGVMFVVIVTLGFGLYVTDQQPQAQAFDLLKTNPTNRAEMDNILNNSSQIRAGLLNTYLARTRYLSAHGELDHIRWLYDDAFEITFERGLSIQENYEMVARPFLYQPVDEIDPPKSTNSRWMQTSSLSTEPEDAAELYEKFFDEPIVEGEKEAVVQAVRTTWDPNRAQEAWQAVDDREVFLEQQSLTHQDLGDGVHGFELHETYSNQTVFRQEVVYYFSLPESAVITGVWLGHGEATKQFEFRVSPRGAAQQVYQEQVQRRVDPALVEQIGPQQYRVRVFPIDPLRESWDDTSAITPDIEAGDDMHLWLSWQVLEQDGQIPMPQLSELRNVYWDQQTVRNFPAGIPTENDDWLPTSIPSPAPNRLNHTVTFADGRIVIAVEPTGPAPELPVNLTFAAVLDRSFSMSDKASEVDAVLKKLSELSPRTDIYLTASQVRDQGPSLKKLIEITDEDLVFFGGQSSAEIMQQFSQLNNGTEYDAIFVITDDGTFSTTANRVENVAVPDAPVWMIHLGGVFPDGYDDNTLEILQASRGGAVTSLDDAVSKLAYFWANPDSELVDGYLWTTYPAGSAVDLPADAVTHSIADPFAKIAARQLILSEMRANKGQITDVALLDGLHAIAVEQAIVTPFSSMIVLVNAAQEQRLDTLENRNDRFEREVEQVGETVAPAPGPVVTGVPEPEEWVLMILSVGMLLWVLWKRHQKQPMVLRTKI